MFAFPFWFLYEPAYEHSEAHILKMYPSVWVRYLYRSAQKNSGYVTGSQFNVSVSSMISSFSFAKNNENMCLIGDCRWHANILLWNIGRVSSEIAPMIESLKNLHYAMVRVWEYQNIFVKCWPYCQQTQQMGFGTLIDFKITYRRYFADNILGDLQ